MTRPLFEIRGASRILGILGDPVGHSLSPLMQNAALRESGIDAVYVPFLVRPADLPAAVAGLRALRILGVNVTIPHKEAILPLLDEVDREAALIGAVNTVVNREGRLVGFNTDGVGLLASLAEDLAFSAAGKRILLLGAGGACRAAVVALARSGASWIGIANRSADRAERLSRELAAKLPGTPLASLPLVRAALEEHLPAVDLVINTTAVGLRGEDLQFFPWTAVASGCHFYDMVYRPGGTPWLNRAQRENYPAANGLGMLAAQGEEAFFLWTGKRPPSGVMRCRLLAEVV